MNWKEYERRKAEIQQKNLTNKEYEKMIKALCDEMEGKHDRSTNNNIYN